MPGRYRMTVLILPRADNRKGLLIRILIGLGALLISTSLAVYALSAWELAATYQVGLEPLRVTPTSDLVSEGERLAHVYGCSGCHLEAGNVLFEAPGVVRLVAPNLTRVAPSYSDEEFVRLLRHGVKRDGTSLIAMPASDFNGLADRDLAAILAWVRARSPLPDAVAGGTQWGPLGRIAIVTGKVPFSAKSVVAVLPRLDRPTAPAEALGAYLVTTTCTHCHSMDDEHDDGWGVVAPPLRLMGQAYPDDAFRALLRTGIGMGGRDLGLMSELARSDFSHLTDPEIAAIHAYLNAAEEE